MGTRLLWKEVFQSIPGCMLREPVCLEALPNGFLDDGLEIVLGVSAELARVRVVRVGHVSNRSGGWCPRPFAREFQRAVTAGRREMSLFEASAALVEVATARIKYKMSAGRTRTVLAAKTAVDELAEIAVEL